MRVARTFVVISSLAASFAACVETEGRGQRASESEDAAETADGGSPVDGAPQGGPEEENAGPADAAPDAADGALADADASGDAAVGDAAPEAGSVIEDVPTIQSSTHPSQTTFYADANVAFAWTYPNVADTDLSGSLYVLDAYGTTLPTAATGILLPIAQKSTIRAGVTNGVWAMHVASVDKSGHVGTTAGHYQVRIGPDPGRGGLSGAVTSGMTVLPGATITISRGLFANATTSGAGKYAYSVATLPAQSYEVTASKPGYASATKLVTITANAITVVDFALTP